jgi:hypothetical protein
MQSSVNQPPQQRDRNEDYDSSDEDENEETHVQKKQMSYSELVRNFSLHNKKIQQAYFEAKRKLESGFDYNQFVKVRKYVKNI